MVMMKNNPLVQSLTTEWLYEQYITLNRTLDSLGQEFNLSVANVHRLLAWHGIHKRLKNNMIDITGQRCNMLLPIKPACIDGVHCWECKCDCGKTVYKTSTSLRHAKPYSCGCTNLNYFGYKDLSKSQWNNVVDSARNRGIPVNITIEDAWNQYEKQNRLCALTNLPITLSAKGRNKSTASLDRIDNDKPYDLDNIQWVHKVINMTRGTLTIEEFVIVSRLVSNKFTDLDTSNVQLRTKYACKRKAYSPEDDKGIEQPKRRFKRPNGTKKTERAKRAKKVKKSKKNRKTKKVA